MVENIILFCILLFIVKRVWNSVSNYITKHRHCFFLMSSFRLAVQTSYTIESKHLWSHIWWSYKMAQWFEEPIPNLRITIFMSFSTDWNKFYKSYLLYSSLIEQCEWLLNIKRIRIHNFEIRLKLVVRSSEQNPWNVISWSFWPHCASVCNEVNI